jgi:hypothetical protein
MAIATYNAVYLHMIKADDNFGFPRKVPICSPKIGENLLI